MAAGGEYSCCPVKYCLCSWRRECSPVIPRVAPAREYACIEAGPDDDDDPAWLVLVGVMTGVTVTSLGLHRFRVARSGRIRRPLALVLPLLAGMRLLFQRRIRIQNAWYPTSAAAASGPLFPINGRGVYVKEDDTIYFLHGQSLYSYKLCLNQQGEQHSMMPPTTVARLSPFRQGSGFVVHLDGLVMCSVWIGEEFGCDCDTEHVLITTFRIKGGDSNKHFVPKGIDVLHSTCRLLDRSPSKRIEPHCRFCFLQEYEAFNHENATPPAKRQRGYAVPLESMIVSVSSNVGSSTSMIACCRVFF